MAGSTEVRSQTLEAYKNFNKFTLFGSLGVALFVPVLAVPALALATVDAAQIYAINKINKKPVEQKVIFQKGGARQAS